MTSAGLGQLADDKRMCILAASQSDGVTVEHERLNHGLLTYALMLERLAEGKADGQPRYGAVTNGEWLSYAEQRVPALSELPPPRTARAVLSRNRSALVPAR